MRIHGGLGNQLFQYAYIYALSQRQQVDYLLDLSAYQEYKVRAPELSNFKKEPIYAARSQIPFYERFPLLRNKSFLFRKFLGLCRNLNPYDYQEKSKGFDQNFLEISRGYIRGFFQSEKYFKEYQSDIFSLFSFSEGTQARVQSFQTKKILHHIDHYVAISIRRGDFAIEKDHFLLPMEFYLLAKEEYFSDKYVLIFSDDQERCMEQFRQYNIPVILTNSLSPIEQLCLMANCKNFIISNSTFSWWGAYLSQLKEKCIVRPLLKFDQDHKGEDYMRDHYPEEWIPYPWGW